MAQFNFRRCTELISS